MKFKIKKFKLKKDKPQELNLKKVEPEPAQVESPAEYDLEKMEEYNRLQKEYNENPSEELGIKLTELYSQLYVKDESEKKKEIEEFLDNTMPNESLVSAIDEDYEPEKTAEEIIQEQTELNKDILKKAEDDGKLDDTPKKSGLSKLKSFMNTPMFDKKDKKGLFSKKEESAKIVMEDNEVRAETIEETPEITKEEKFLPMVQDQDQIVLEKIKREKERKEKEEEALREKEQQLEKYIEEQKKEQPQVHENRLKWAEKNEKLHEQLDEKLPTFFKSLEPKFTKQTIELGEEEAKIEYPDPKPINELPFPESLKICQNEKCVMKGLAHDGACQGLSTDEEESPELEEDEIDLHKTIKTELEKHIENQDEPLKAPDDLGDDLKDNWKFIDVKRQREIIEQVKQEREKEIELKKQSIFARPVDFSFKKKKLRRKKPKEEKKTFFKKMFEKKIDKLKGVDAYCYKCKHTVQSHQYKGKSTGCADENCGCLVGVQTILDMAKIEINFDKVELESKADYKCNCGHREIVHKQFGFCEQKGCECMEFRIADIPKED